MSLVPMQRLRPAAQRAFYRHAPVRGLLSMIVGAREGFRNRYALAHLAGHAEEDAFGPVQRDEALLLYALTRVLRPRVVVEVGFLGGQSAFNFLQALRPDAMLYSFDIAGSAEEIAAKMFSGFENFRFQRVSQDEITPEHVDGRPVDLLFLDASHELELNQRTFDRLAPMLQDGGVLVVHDTGTWAAAHMSGRHRAAAAADPEQWLSDEEYEHRREERQFVNWVLEHRPEYAQLHLHSRYALRHGLTLLQRRRPLAIGPSA